MRNCRIFAMRRARPLMPAGVSDDRSCNSLHPLLQQFIGRDADDHLAGAVPVRMPEQQVAFAAPGESGAPRALGDGETHRASGTAVDALGHGSRPSTMKMMTTSRMTPIRPVGA